MDISALKKERLEVWVDFEEGTRLKIRHLSREDILAIAKKSVKVAFDRKSHQKTEEIDVLGKEVLVAQEAVVDWEGFEMDGQPFTCNPENVAFLVRKWGLFARFVTDICADLNTLIAAEKEETEKNSSATSGQESISPA